MCWNMKVLLRVLFILTTPSHSQQQFEQRHHAQGQLQQGHHQRQQQQQGQNQHLGQEQHHAHDQEQGQPVITMVVNITQEDKLNIELADRVGVSHLAVSYPEGINCTLKKSRSIKTVTKCDNITIPECKKVHKVKLNNVTEDCSRQREYCQYNFRTQELTKQNIICERDLTQICTGSCPATSCPTYCERNPIVVCSTEHQMVVVTEKRQRCGESKALVTTKICFTYPDASWTCRELRPTHDCERESVRAIANELGVPKISCVEKEQDPVCLPKNCRLASNDTHCLTTDLPVQVELEDFVCEECSQGRTKLRPVLVQVENCDHEVTQEFCVETEEHKDEWTKTCTVPNTMQPKVLRNVLLDQQEDENNEINDKKGDERRKKIKQSKLVRLNLPMQWQNIKGTKDEDETEEQIKISDQITKNYKMELEREREDNSDKNVNEKQDKGLSFKPQTRENHVEEQVKVQINDQQSKTSNNMHLVRKDSDNIHERNHRNRNNEKQTEVEIQSQVGKKHVEHQNILRNVKIELGQEGREYEQKKLEDSTACEQHNKHESREHEQQDSREHEQQTILPRPFINTFNHHPRKLIQERKQQVEVGKRQNIKSDDANQNHKTLPVQRDKCRSQRGFSLLGLVSCLKKNNIRTTSRSSSNRNQATARISHQKNQSIHENSFDSNKATFVTSQKKSRPTSGTHNSKIQPTSGISYDKTQPTSKTTYAKKQPTSKTFPELTQSKPTSTSPHQSSVHSPRVRQQKLALSSGVQRSSYAQNSSNFEQHAQGKGSSSNIFQDSTSAELTTSKSIEIRRTVTQKNRVKHLVDGFVVSAPPKINSHTHTAKSRGSTENVSPEITTPPSFAGTTLASSQIKVARKSIFNNHRNKNRNVFRVPILSAKSDLALNGKRKENVKTSEGKETKNIFGLRSRGSALQRNNNLLRSQTHSRQLSSEEVNVKNVDINNGGIKKMQSTKSKHTENQAKTVVKLNNEGIKNYTLNRKPLNVEANEEAGQGTKPKKAIIRIKESSQPIHLNERPIKDITNPTKNKTNKGMQILKPDLVEQNEGQEEPSHMNHRKLVSNKSTCRFPFKCYGEIVLNSSMVSESLQSKQQNEVEIKPIQKNIVNNLQREGTIESNLVTKTAGSEFKQSKNKHHFKLNSSTENPKITLAKGKLPLENRSIEQVEQKMHLLDIELEDPSLSQNQTHISKYEERQVADSQSENIMENKSSDSQSKTIELKFEDNQDIHIEESPRNFEHPDAVKKEHKIELIEKPNNIEKIKLASREEIEKLKVASKEQKVSNKNQGVSNSIEDKVSRTPKVIETNTSKVIMDKNKPVETRVKCDDCNCIENIREKVTCKVIKCFKNSQLCFS